MQPTIRLVDLASSDKEERLEEIFAAFRAIYQSSQFVMGEPVKEFESAYAKLTGCSYGIGVNSGTDALLLALRILGVGPGDEVITVANSFIATASPIALVGATPVFADIGEDFNIDPSSVEDSISPKTKAIIPVHLTGNPCQMDRLTQIAKKHNLFIVEDAAQAIGARFDKKPVGSFGEFGCFSLHPLKNLHVWGDGGMMTTNSQSHAEASRQHRNHGQINRDEVEFFSYNSRLDSMQAVVGLSSIKALDKTTEARRRHAKIYDERLRVIEEWVASPITDTARAEHVYHLYMVRAKQRDQLMQYLLSKGIETKIHYPIPIHLQKAAEYLGYKPGDLPVTEKLANEILSLPIRENLSEDQIHQVCDAIESFYAN